MTIVPVHAGAVGAGAERARIAATPEIVSNALVRGFHEFWLARCRDGRLPAKRDMDPVEMRAFLPHLVLTEVLRDPLDFQYRIIGDAVAVRLGNNTGRRVRETALINLTSSAYDNYCAVALSRQPQFLEGRAPTAFSQNRTYLMSRVHCPLSFDGAAVDHIISCMSFL
jgi:hypothetical protein